MAGRRAMWKGIVSFGGVSVPVKLYAVIEDTAVHFHLLHDQDEVRLVQQMVCSLEDKPVDREHMVKGLEVDDGEYVLVEPEDLASIEPEAGRTIAVDRFVEAGEVDPRFYNRAYHLGPDDDLDGYRVLHEALKASGRVGLCQWTMRKREYFGALKAEEKVIALVTLRYADEIARVEDLDLPEPKLKAAELKTARYLIEELAEPFEPGRYVNEYRQRVRELVEAKAAGKAPPKLAAAKPRPEAAEDLQAILEKSLADVRKRKGKPAAPSKGKARSSRGSPARKPSAGTSKSAKKQKKKK